MTCNIVTLPGGTTAYVCGPRSRHQCQCRPPRAMKYLCDWKVSGGTCDKALCDVCGVKPAAGKDLCAEHSEAWRVMLEEKARG